MHEASRLPADTVAQRLVSVDVLRGIAALAVVGIHVPHYAHGGWRLNPFFWPAFLLDYGYLGVPLFVVISGFCIHRRAAFATARTGIAKFSWIQFWKRRFWRLYPPYLAAIVFSLACALLLHDKFHVLTSSIGWDLITHSLLIHNLTDEYSTSLGNGAFWSLGMEEQLYALYFVLFLLMVRCSRWRALWFVVATAIAWRIAVPWIGQWDIQLGPVSLGSWYQWPLHYWLHWTLGAVAVDAYFGNLRLPRWCSSLGWASGLGIVGIVLNENMFSMLTNTRVAQDPVIAALFAQVPTPVRLAACSLGDLAFAVAFFCLINWGLKREVRGGFAGLPAKLLAGVGRFSYSLYLTHVPVIFALEKWAPFGHSPREWPLRYLIYVPVTLIVGFGFFWTVERRFLTGSGQVARRPTEKGESTQIQPSPAADGSLAG